MAVRDTLVKVDNGDQLDDGYFNENPRPELSYNTTDQAEVTTTSNSATELKTYTFAANSVASDVIIEVMIRARGSVGTGGSSNTGTFLFKLDGVTQDTFTVSGDGNTDYRNNGYRLIKYKITPSGAQITAGFTVSVDGSNSATTGTGYLCGVSGWDVRGL